MQLTRRQTVVGAALALASFAGASLVARPARADYVDASTDVLVGSTGNGTKIVVDQMGREVEISEDVQTCATFRGVPFINACIETVGAGHLIINDMPPSFDSEKYGWQYIFAPQTWNAPKFENADSEVDIETVLYYSPDVSFTQNSANIETLEAAGLPVCYLGWDNTDELIRNNTLLGEIFNHQDIAAEYNELLLDWVAEAEELGATIADGDRKTALYASITGLQIPWMVSEWWIEEAGGISVSKDVHTEEKMPFEVEDLINWNPDFIFVSSESDVEELNTNEAYANLTAVQNGDIYIVPTVGHTWGVRTTENAIMLFWAMSKMYPELCTYETLAEKIKYFYNEFFQYEMTDAQVATIIG